VRIDEDAFAVSVAAARVMASRSRCKKISTWFSVILMRSFLCRWMCGAL
jgi:hypothetical protein